MKKIYVVINKQHKLFPQQEELIAQLGEYIEVPVPAEGWDLETMKSQVYSWTSEDEVVFVTPIGAMMKLCVNKVHFYVMFNDKRVKKEEPDGKGGVKQTSIISPEGWRLV